RSRDESSAASESSTRHWPATHRFMTAPSMCTSRRFERSLGRGPTAFRPSVAAAISWPITRRRKPLSTAWKIISISPPPRRGLSFPGDFSDFNNVEGRFAVPCSYPQRSPPNAKRSLRHLKEIALITRHYAPFDLCHHAVLSHPHNRRVAAPIFQNLVHNHVRW